MPWPASGVMCRHTDHSRPVSLSHVTPREVSHRARLAQIREVSFLARCLRIRQFEPAKQDELEAYAALWYGHGHTYTRAELVAEIEVMSYTSSLHTTGADAWRQVRGGALAGTLFAARLAQLMFLLESFYGEEIA